tara:strand:+ start:469 stop:1440 length:972 start_codon:yes stop_codon:yes gene_type:complete
MKNYSFLQQQLHHLSLGSSFVKNSLFEIEKIFFKTSEKDITNNQHVFISGLPRSGTTILLLYIHNFKKHASLTYNDMPFITAPNLFSRFYKKNLFQRKERMHSDGIFYDLFSPEAFDEAFFSTFDNDNDIEQNLLKYISLILRKYNKKKYLSKNNLNYKRIKLIQKIFPNAIFLIPYRDPLQHSFSLYSQHKHFIRIQSQDKFILSYMNYLGHNEFGKNHKSWFKPKTHNDLNNINYWMEQWLLFYENITNNFQFFKNCKLICYEELCYNNEYTNRMKSILELSNSSDFKFKNSLKKITLNADKKLLLDCNKLYDTMKSNFVI